MDKPQRLTGDSSGPTDILNSTKALPPTHSPTQPRTTNSMAPTRTSQEGMALRAVGEAGQLAGQLLAAFQVFYQGIGCQGQLHRN